ncbi:MAG: hypothetical protein WCW93_03925 [Candidatus Paceibacterota bacterium]
MSPERPNCYESKDCPNPVRDKAFCQKSPQDVVERQNISIGSFEMIIKEAFGVELNPIDEEYLKSLNQIQLNKLACFLMPDVNTMKDIHWFDKFNEEKNLVDSGSVQPSEIGAEITEKWTTGKIKEQFEHKIKLT